METGDAGRIWRARVQLIDRPGTLAELSARLGESDCNLLGVAVLPVASELTAFDQPGQVVDELVLRAPERMTRRELIPLFAIEGATFVGLAPASVSDLIDPDIATLQVVSAILAGRGSVDDALCQVLRAESVQRDAHTGMGSNAGTIAVERGGRRARIAISATETAIASRSWAPFTEGELARASALLSLLDDAARSGWGHPVPRPAPIAPVCDVTGPSRQLSALDVQFLNAETSTTFVHIGTLTTLDSREAGKSIRLETLQRVIGSRLHLIAPLRWRLREVPLGLDLPYWEDSPTVDLHHHIKEVEVPSPGTDSQLCAVVAELAATPLDRSRPLWEFHLISGLADGRQALYTKVHHSVIDGVSGAEIMAAVLDVVATPEPASPPASGVALGRTPGVLEMLGASALHGATRPVSIMRSLPRVLPGLLEMPASAGIPGSATMSSVASRVHEFVTRTPRSVPQERAAVPPTTPFNAQISEHRTFAFVSLPLDEIKLVKNAFHGTVNDVVMALCTTALRRWLIDHDGLPDRAIVAGIPVSIRTAEQMGTGGNQFSIMPCVLPVHEPDPVQRMALLGNELRGAKQRFEAGSPALLQELAAAVPQAFHGAAIRAAMRAGAAGPPLFNLLISNVPGPQLPLYAAGSRVTANFPVSAISDFTGGINITVMSYNGHLDFGIIACPTLVPDVSAIADHLREALAELVPQTSPHSVG